MRNMAVIISVEFEANGFFLPVPIQNGSAAYEDKQSRPTAGELHKHTLKFKIAGLVPKTSAWFDWFLWASVIRFTDVNGLRVTLGSEDLPVEVNIDRTIEGKPGSFRGYEVSVKWESPWPAPSESFI